MYAIFFLVPPMGLSLISQLHVTLSDWAGNGTCQVLLSYTVLQNTILVILDIYPLSTYLTHVSKIIEFKYIMLRYFCALIFFIHNITKVSTVLR
jgi:hypothetical protein